MVDRCVCINITFERLHELHRAEGLDLEGLKESTGCCSGCANCEPYIRLMLKSGQTEFPVLSPRQCALAMRD